jgi:D-alanyl-D-alanine carboxypeptidase (penicillin-binding protein 5/6)
MKIKINKKFIACLFLFVILLSYSLPSFVFATTASSDVSVNAPVAILIDLSSGKVLYEKNSNQKMYPASLTKILTAIIVLEKCKLDEIVTVSEDAVMDVSSRICNCKFTNW